MSYGVQIVFDCADPGRLSKFYAHALGYKMQDPPDGYSSWEEWLKKHDTPEEEWNWASAIVDPEGKGPRLYFQQMDTPKPEKNRLHIDINASGGLKVSLTKRKEQVDKWVDHLQSIGATRVHELEEFGEYCVIMFDPEGNEFCVQ